MRVAPLFTSFKRQGVFCALFSRTSTADADPLPPSALVPPIALIHSHSSRFIPQVSGSSKPTGPPQLTSQSAIRFSTKCLWYRKPTLSIWCFNFMWYITSSTRMNLSHGKSNTISMLEARSQG
ncbi:hypothetical protein BC939DRAFT_443707 [Gamsiella multidivaricata]|uniref:uncharacterized protein n=1 Tax=Gamsiella multidivaricata TaxID=101098 RepID=UPI00221EB912|nr:uncharacterized protein BC939DRAFT_443707 [Gamsiella multidivaricata]KAI7828143.1 hypothetical protein BC939DRAFT_443707 [Gamsiella multidivaricata]